MNNLTGFARLLVSNLSTRRSYDVRALREAFSLARGENLHKIPAEVCTRDLVRCAVEQQLIYHWKDGLYRVSWWALRKGS